MYHESLTNQSMDIIKHHQIGHSNIVNF